MCQLDQDNVKLSMRSVANDYFSLLVKRKISFLPLSLISIRTFFMIMSYELKTHFFLVVVGWKLHFRIEIIFRSDLSPHAPSTPLETTPETELKDFIEENKNSSLRSGKDCPTITESDTRC